MVRALEAGHPDGEGGEGDDEDVLVDRATEEVAAAAEALEALAPMDPLLGPASARNTGATIEDDATDPVSGKLSGPISGRLGPLPVSASDLALLHARAHLAVAADYDAAALDVRDKLIADQQLAIQALRVGPDAS